MQKGARLLTHITSLACQIAQGQQAGAEAVLVSGSVAFQQAVVRQRVQDVVDGALVEAQQTAEVGHTVLGVAVLEGAQDAQGAIDGRYEVSHGVR